MRCVAKTKEGHQCKRLCIDGENFCSQHGKIIYPLLHKMTIKEKRKWFRKYTFLHSPTFKMSMDFRVN
jgi:hypothetical protein